MLNIPNSVLDIIKQKNNILITGIGGGFDIYAGIPIYHLLKKIGKQVHLANYSFTDFDQIITSCQPEIINKDLLGITGNAPIVLEYFPEGYLAEWLKLVYKNDIPVWCFRKTGVLPLINSYKYLVDKLKIDLILLIDGGVDSIMTGAEEGSGTILEDSVSLAAISQIENIDKISICIGFGTEVEEKLSHYNALMNMATLVKNNAFYGSCSLVNNMECYKIYKSACYYVFNKEFHKTSHIHRRILPAIEGEFGDFHATDEDEFGLELFITPLMSIYWLFKTDLIVSMNRIIPYLNETIEFYDVVQVAMPYIKNNKIFPRNPIPYL